MEEVMRLNPFSVAILFCCLLLPLLHGIVDLCLSASPVFTRMSVSTHMGLFLVGEKCFSALVCFCAGEELRRTATEKYGIW